MTLDEIRLQIDMIDTEIKPLFLKRMECARLVAEEKAKTGGDVFVLERELAIIEKRASDVESVHDEYVAFLRHLMSVSRRYQYGILTDLQERVIQEELNKAGLDQTKEHNQIEIALTCSKGASDLNLYMNMIKLNGLALEQMNLISEGDIQKVSMVLDGSMKEEAMRRLICQIAKEAERFAILDLKDIRA